MLLPCFNYYTQFCTLLFTLAKQLVFSSVSVSNESPFFLVFSFILSSCFVLQVHISVFVQAVVSLTCSLKLHIKIVSSWFCLFSFVLFCSYNQIRSVAQLCPTPCDPMNRSTPGLPVRHQLPEFTEAHVHRVSDAI